MERFKTVLLSALTSSPKLLKADPPTLVQAMREAAMWDLEPDGIDAVIVPFWNSRRSVYEGRLPAHGPRLRPGPVPQSARPVR